MINTQYGNYVKFIRGTTAAWAALPDEEKSFDTLYFISDTGSTTGKLYLGSKLISDGDLSSATSMADLNDVLIAEGITDQSILVYNASSGKWENKTLLDIFLAINEVFTGATADSNGKAGLVPAPVAGQEALFLRGDGQWANPVSGVTSEIENIRQTLTTLISDDVDLSIRNIAQNEASSAVASIVSGAPEAFDTLKEIADWIQANQGSVDVAGLTTKVTNLEKTIYGVEANPDTSTEGVIGLVTIASTLQTDLDKLSGTVATHTTEITEIKEALRWQDMVEATV